MSKWVIKTNRKYSNQPYENIIHEWEDCIAKLLHLSVVNNFPKGLIDFDRRCRKFAISPLAPFCKHKYIVFWTSPRIADTIDNSRNAIPWIIDFYLTQNDIDSFFKATSKNKYVFISSAEVLEKLAQHPSYDSNKYIHVPLCINHLRKGSCSQRKKYDLAMLGRSDSQLMSYVVKFASEHKDFTYVTREMKGLMFSYYVHKNGEKNLIESSESHETYERIMQECRIGLWSTRGLEEKKCNGYNQVTPRLLELMSQDCHVIARYPLNADTKYHELPQMFPSSDSYEIFYEQVTRFLKEDVNMQMYEEYLLKHSVFQRCKIIKNYLYD